MDENNIIKSVLDGNIGNYEALVNRYHVGLIIHCDRLVGDRDMAEDIAQESFIKAFNSLGNFDSTKSRFSTWLYKVATNKAYDHLRVEGRHRTTEYDIEQIADQAAPNYEAEESKREIRSAVAKLQPPQHREVIEAYYWRGEDYKTIASRLKVPLNTVRTWLRRAKQQLRSDLS